MGLRALARRLWTVSPASAADTRPSGLSTLAQTTGVPRRPALDRRAVVDVADHDEQSPYARGVTLVAPRGEP
jgi:hypothetical protein